MARRVFLHCGTAKSGTTFLQDLWWRHRGELRQRGLLLPGTALRDHFHAAALVKGMDVIVEDLAPAEREVWRRLVEETRHWSGDVLISHEHFSDSSAEAAAAAAAAAAVAAGPSPRPGTTRRRRRPPPPPRARLRRHHRRRPMQPARLGVMFQMQSPQPRNMVKAKAVDQVFRQRPHYQPKRNQPH